jgi:hypothetical protein
MPSVLYITLFGLAGLCPSAPGFWGKSRSPCYLRKQPPEQRSATKVSCQQAFGRSVVDTTRLFDRITLRCKGCLLEKTHFPRPCEDGVYICSPFIKAHAGSSYLNAPDSDAMNAPVAMLGISYKNPFSTHPNHTHDSKPPSGTGTISSCFRGSMVHARTTPSSPVVTIISSPSSAFPESNLVHHVTWFIS